MLVSFVLSDVHVAADEVRGVVRDFPLKAGKRLMRTRRERTARFRPFPGVK